MARSTTKNVCVHLEGAAGVLESQDDDAAAGGEGGERVKPDDLVFDVYGLDFILKTGSVADRLIYENTMGYRIQRMVPYPKEYRRSVNFIF
uniref:DNA-directed RNA polymerase n=1 Tax=Steinernema glaseri TaxID=37863 RepID=A0A1I8A3S3_9BILA